MIYSIQERRLDIEIQKIKSFEDNNQSLNSILEKTKSFMKLQLKEHEKDFVEINVLYIPALTNL